MSRDRPDDSPQNMRSGTFPPMPRSGFRSHQFRPLDRQYGLNFNVQDDFRRWTGWKDLPFCRRNTANMPDPRIHVKPANVSMMSLYSIDKWHERP